MTRRSFEALACLLVAALVYLPYWSASVLPFHDSIAKYQYFHFAYSHVLAFGELPLWVPYGTYGIPSAVFQLSSLTPAQYLVGAAGIAAGAKHTLLLFKASGFLEVALYAMGLLLLARSVYEHPLSRWMVVLGGLLSLSWLFQPHFNFLAFYLYPYVFLFVAAFLRTADPGKLWLAASVLLVSIIGTAPYLAPLHALVLAVVVAVAFAAGARPALTPDWRRWLLRWESGLAAILAVTLVLMARYSTEDIVTLAAGRDPDSNRVPLEVFLEYGRMTLATTASGYLSGAATHGDNTYYIGLLPLVLVLLGALRLRDPRFLGVAAAAGGLAWLSVGGWFSTLAYHFPGMWLYRHIGLTFGLAGLLILIASGWVIDDWLKRAAEPGRPQPGPHRRQLLVVSIALALAMLDAAVHWREYDTDLFPIFHTAFLFLVPLRLAAYAVAAVLAWMRGPRRIFVPLIAAYLFDIGSYQVTVFLTLPHYEARLPAGSFEADALPYRAARFDRAAEPVMEWKLALREPRTTLIGETYGNSAFYSFTYTFLGVDPCYPRVRTDLLARDVAAALAARGGRPQQWPQDDFLPRGDRAFGAMLGCEAPKIVLTHGHVSAGSAAAARELLKSAPDPLGTPVLETSAAPAEPGAPPASGGNVRVTGFSANRVELEVRNDRGAGWVYYADAFHSGWRARIGSDETPVVRANVGFKAVRVPPGNHVVVLTFGEGGRRYASGWLALVGSFVFLAGFVAAIVALLRTPR